MGIYIKHLTCKKCQTNQKQQLANQKLDTKLRPRTLQCNVDNGVAKYLIVYQNSSLDGIQVTLTTMIGVVTWQPFGTEHRQKGGQ